MNPIAKRLLVLSFDGLSGLDLDRLKQEPSFQRFMEKGVYSTQVKSVFPSLTYPAHTTVVTGVSPKKHGIIDNTLVQPGRKEPDWHWYWKDIHTETIYQYARKKGLSTASLLWPVTAGAPIDYNMPEIWPTKPWVHQGMLSLLYGSKGFQLHLLKKYGHLLNGIHQPNLDDFVQQALLDTLRTKDTHLTLAHYTDLDSMRHAHGFDSFEAQGALSRHSQRLEEIFKVLEETKKLEETVIWIFGDHSSMDIDRVIALNPLFAHHGLLRQDSKTKKIQWQAWAKSCDGACYIYTKTEADKKKALELIQKVDEKGVFDAIYTSEEAAALGADPACSFMLDAARGYGFSDALSGPVLCSAGSASLRYKGDVMRNMHGYNPGKKDYTSFLGVSGPGIRQGQNIGPLSLLDQGPTMMRILGMAFETSEGRVLKEIFGESVKSPVS